MICNHVEASLQLRKVELQTDFLSLRICVTGQMVTVITCVCAVP